MSPAEVEALKDYHASRRQQELRRARRARCDRSAQAHLDLSRLHELMYHDLIPVTAEHE